MDTSITHDIGDTSCKGVMNNPFFISTGNIGTGPFVGDIDMPPCKGEIPIGPYAADARGGFINDPGLTVDVQSPFSGDMGMPPCKGDMGTGPYVGDMHSGIIEHPVVGDSSNPPCTGDIPMPPFHGDMQTVPFIGDSSMPGILGGSEQSGFFGEFDDAPCKGVMDNPVFISTGNMDTGPFVGDIGTGPCVGDIDSPGATCGVINDPGLAGEIEQMPVIGEIPQPCVGDTPIAGISETGPRACFGVIDHPAALGEISHPVCGDMQTVSAVGDSNNPPSKGWIDQTFTGDMDTPPVRSAVAAGEIWQPALGDMPCLFGDIEHPPFIGTMEAPPFGTMDTPCWGISHTD